MSRGQTIGDVVVHYMGSYSVENLEIVQRLNPSLRDLDSVAAGDTLVVWDRRPGIFEPEVRGSGAAPPARARGRRRAGPGAGSGDGRGAPPGPGRDAG